jgi:hypothetical protein
MRSRQEGRSRRLPHPTFNIIAKRGDNSLITRVTNHSLGLSTPKHDYCHTRHCRRVAQKEAQLTLCATNGSREDPAYPEVEVSKANSEAVATESLGVCHQYQRRVHPGTASFARPWCIPEFEMPHDTTGRWGSATVAPRSMTVFNLLYGGKQRSSSGSVW